LPLSGRVLPNGSFGTDDRHLHGHRLLREEAPGRFAQDALQLPQHVCSHRVPASV